MIEISNINPVNKKSLLATCSVRISPWRFTMHDVKIFEKEDQAGKRRWIGLPAKEGIGPNGEKTYFDLLSFDTEAIKNKFRDQIMGAIDQFLVANPSLKIPDVITPSDELPF